MAQKKDYESFYLAERAKKDRLQDYVKELIIEKMELEKENKAMELRVESLKYDVKALREKLEPWLKQDEVKQ